MEKSKLKEKLISHDIKPTLQRIIIYNFLLESKNKHLSSEEIYINLSEEFSGISRATVYNTLKLFKEKCLIRTVKTDTKEVIYDFNIIPHGHFICDICGEIQDFDYNYSNFKENLECFNEEFRTIEITARGVCKKCLKKQKNMQTKN